MSVYQIENYIPKCVISCSCLISSTVLSKYEYRKTNTSNFLISRQLLQSRDEQRLTWRQESWTNTNWLFTLPAHRSFPSFGRIFSNIPHSTYGLIGSCYSKEIRALTTWILLGQFIYTVHSFFFQNQSSTSVGKGHLPPHCANIIHISKKNNLGPRTE